MEDISLYIVNVDMWIIFKNMLCKFSFQILIFYNIIKVNIMLLKSCFEPFVWVEPCFEIGFYLSQMMKICQVQIWFCPTQVVQLAISN